MILVQNELVGRICFHSLRIIKHENIIVKNNVDLMVVVLPHCKSKHEIDTNSSTYIIIIIEVWFDKSGSTNLT